MTIVIHIQPIIGKYVWFCHTYKRVSGNTKTQLHKMKISTISELENWMSKNGIKNTFTPKNRFVSDEGLGLEIIDGLYILYFIERSERQNIEYFKSEKDAAEFIFDFLKSGEAY